MSTTSLPTIETAERDKEVAKESVHRNFLTLSSSPHIRHVDSVPEMMIWVIVALMPAMAGAILFYGVHAIILIITCVTVSVITEFLITKFLKRSSIKDHSAIVTGLLLAFTLPPGLPPWIAALGTVFAIGVVKQAFGGLGMNFMNPALGGRAFLMASYPLAMNSWLIPRWGSMNGIDAITTATPLAHFKASMLDGTFQALDFQDALSSLFFGNVGGCIGETSALALLLGAMVLWYKHIIGFRIPVAFIGTMFILFWLFNGTGELFTSAAIIIPVYQILSGGLLLGALFMATDTVTSPVSANGKLLFGIGCGTLVFIIRKFGGYPEGVCYAIILMNILVPQLDRLTRPSVYGEVKKRD